LDFEIFINNPSNSEIESTKNLEVPTAIWQPAEMSQEDIDTIKRFYVLLNDESLRGEYGEQVRAAGHTHSISIEKIWERVFLTEARLIVENDSYEFAKNHLDKQTLGELLSSNLKRVFEGLYPEHPEFPAPLGMNAVSKLVNDLFSGARKTHEGVQQLAENFAVPLGLVAKRGDDYVLESEENLYSLPLVEKIVALVNESENSTVSLKSIYKNLKAKPYGLVREAQHLILSALVAQQKIEFVTTNGDRINRRSLDLKIIWDDIFGVAKPADVTYESKRLTEWARLLTEIKGVKTIDVAEDLNAVKEALKKWFDDWDSARILERFNELPDEILNTKIWYISVNIEKTFGSVASSLQKFFDESISLEACLQRIADAFSDSEDEFLLRQTDLIMLVSFIKSASNRETIWKYLAICERTEIEEIETKRNKLTVLLDKSATEPTSQSNREMKSVWRDFHKEYAELFAVKHDTIMKSHQLQEKFDEIVKSDEYWEFQNLSKLPIFNRKYWNDAQKILMQFRELDCRFDVRKMLKSHPFCACSFNLAQMEDWENLPNSLTDTIEKGRKSFRRTLNMLAGTLVQLLEGYLKEETDREFVKSGADILEKFQNKSKIEKFSTNQLIILDKILTTLTFSPTVNIEYPANSGLMSSEELRQNINSWLDELPSEPAYLKF